MKSAAYVLAASILGVAAEQDVLYVMESISGAAVSDEDYGATPLAPLFDDCMPVAVNGTFITNKMQCVGTYEDGKTFRALPDIRVVEEIKAQPFSQMPGSEDYHNFEEINAAFDVIAAKYPSFTQIIDLTEYYDTPATFEGRHIFALKMSDNVREDEDEPNTLVVSNHHSRELITPELALDIALRLAEGYGDDPDLTRVINEQQVYIIWNQNPDGLKHTWDVNRLWRKNRFPNAGGSFGIDLNRNYPIGYDFSCAGSTNPSSETYRGTGPASEPETQTMIAFQADRNFAKVLDFHSFALEVRIPYGSCASLPGPVDSYLAQTGREMADIMNYRQVRSCCMGGNVHLAYHDHGSLTYLVETGTAFMPSAPEMRAELVRTWPGNKWFLEWPVAASGHVIDSLTDEPVRATFTVSELSYNLSEKSQTDARYGRYHMWLPTGTYTFIFSAPGYAPTTLRIATVYGENVDTTVRMSPISSSASEF